MHTFDSKHGAHREIAAALRRARPVHGDASLARSHAIKALAVACMGASVTVDDIVLLVVTFCAGAIGLWISICRDDTATEMTVDQFYDTETGLALASALPHVLADELAMRTLTGRVAVMTIDLPEVSRHSVAGDADAARVLLGTVAHRLQSQAWAEAADGPFGALLFLRRPGTFIIVRRDVLDDRTSRWLAEKLISVVNEPVPWAGAILEPRAVLGVAIGTNAKLAALPTLASEACGQARRGDAGEVVILHTDRPAPPPPAEVFLISLDDGRPVGRHFSQTGAAAGHDMFEDFSSLMRTVDQAISATALTPRTCFISASATSLSHPDTTGEIIARVNAANAHGRVGVVLPPDFPSDAAHRAVRAVQTLHDCGVVVYVDRSDPLHRARELPVCGIDGIIVDVAEKDMDWIPDPLRVAVEDLGVRMIRRAPISAPPEAVILRRGGDSGPFGSESTIDASQTDRPIRGGQVAQLATGPASGHR